METMKNMMKITLATLAIVCSFSVKAQFDDVYYDNSSDNNNYNTYQNNEASSYDAPDETEVYYDEEGYDDIRMY